MSVFTATNGENDTNFVHRWVRTRIREATGENLLGKIVTSYVEDWVCSVCKTETIKLFKGTPKEAKITNDAITS